MCKWYLRDDLVVKNKNSLKVTQIDKDSFFKKKKSLLSHQLLGQEIQPSPIM